MFLIKSLMTACQCNPFFLIASILMGLTCLIHTFVGGKYGARPLLKTKELHHVPKYVNYYCWHLVTITLAGLAWAFYKSAQIGASIDLAYFATGLTFLFGLWNVGLILMFKLNPIHFPQWLFFFITSFFAFLGLNVTA